MMNLLEAALKYREESRSVILVSESKKPLVRWDSYRREKASPEQIKSWWQKWPGAGIGIITGAISGLTVIDIDSEDGLSAIEDLKPQIHS